MLLLMVSFASADSIVGEWSFDTIGMTDVYVNNSYTFTANHASILNGTTGISGYAADFTNGAYRLTGSSSAYSFGLNPFSVSAWYYTDGESGFPGQIIGQYNSGANHRGWSLMIQPDNTPVFNAVNYYSTPVEKVVGSAVQTGQWNHIVGVRYDNSTQKIYINGELDNTEYYPILDNYEVSALYIGEKGTSGFDAKGLVDEVRIFDYALTDEQVLEEYYRFVEPPTDNLTYITLQIFDEQQYAIEDAFVLTFSHDALTAAAIQGPGEYQISGQLLNSTPGGQASIEVNMTEATKYLLIAYQNISKSPDIITWFEVTP